MDEGEIHTWNRHTGRLQARVGRLPSLHSSTPPPLSSSPLLLAFRSNLYCALVPALQKKLEAFNLSHLLRKNGTQQPISINTELNDEASK